MRHIQYKTVGRFIVAAFILFYAVYFVDRVFFSAEPQYRISSGRCMTAADMQTNRLFFRTAFDVQAPVARVFMKIIVRTHAFVYLNGTQVKTVEARPVDGCIVDITQNVRRGENLLALKVQNRELKKDSVPLVSAAVFMVDGNGSMRCLIKPADWKVSAAYPAEKIGQQWYQRAYPDEDWQKPAWQTALNSWGWYSPFPLSVYGQPVSGKKLAVSGVRGRTVLSHDFTLPARADSMVIRLLASEACVLTLNAGAFVDIRPLQNSVGMLSVKRFLKKGHNRLSLIFLGHNTADFLVNALYLDSSGHCVGGFSSDETWHCSRPQGVVCRSDIREPGYPVKILNPSISLESRLRELLWKAGWGIGIAMLIAGDLFLFRKNSGRLPYAHKTLIIRCYYIYLLPLILIIFIAIIARDYRVDHSSIYSMPVFTIFPVLIFIQRVLSFR